MESKHFNRFPVSQKGSWPQAEYFNCPVCRKDCEHKNIGTEHWFFCENCRIKWLAGDNMLSTWRGENKKIWLKNAKFLSRFKNFTQFIRR